MHTKKLALVTGGNKGIGLEVTRQLAQAGFTVLLAARDVSKARAEASKLAAQQLDVRPVELDVTQAAQRASVAAYIEKEFGHLDALVNIGSLTVIGSDEQAAAWAGPAYASSKAALNMLTVLQATRLKGTQVKINAAHPGWVQTELGGEGAPMDVATGAKTAVRLAQLPADGPSGRFFHLDDALPW
jgi:NAD(P)-dependent dehydrogenase (short-subunit alcohol dehydrogenase family)